MTTNNSFEIARRQVDIAGKHLDLNPGILEMLKSTKREVVVHFPVKMDDGTMKMFTGYRIVHIPARGPA